MFESPEALQVCQVPFGSFYIADCAHLLPMTEALQAHTTFCASLGALPISFDCGRDS